jgi:hypothetical protein
MVDILSSNLRCESGFLCECEKLINFIVSFMVGILFFNCHFQMQNIGLSFLTVSYFEQ